jgi:hypothetical protein
MSELDRPIDATLRDMVADEGPPDLRRRVLARIEGPARRPARRWLALAAAAGIVAAVASVALLRTAPGREPVRPSVRSSPVVPSATPSAPARAFPVVARATPAPPPRPLARPRRADQPPEERLPLDLAAGVDVQPIELPPLAVVPISGENIAAVTALTIERMQIEPLAEPQP